MDEKEAGQPAEREGVLQLSFGNCSRPLFLRMSERNIAILAQIQLPSLHLIGILISFLLSEVLREQVFYGKGFDIRTLIVFRPGGLELKLTKHYEPMPSVRPSALAAVAALAALPPVRHQAH